MEWRNLAWKNIVRSLQRYLGYLLASTSSVTVFCMFFIFIFNPAVTRLAALNMVAVVMGICVTIVACFAVFFIFFFHGALVRTRSKEFGLLMTLGMRPDQIGRLLFFESLFIGVIALLFGMLLGILGTQPFFWAMETVLGLSTTIPFEIPIMAMLVTSIFFGIVFLLEACLVSWRVTKRTPKLLLLGARSQQIAPKVSWLRVALGILCLGIAYTLAIVYSYFFILTALPIVLLTTYGTFLLYGQILVMVLSWLRKRVTGGVKLLIVSRLTYRVRDYARMLAIVTILNTMVLTGMGSVNGFLQILRARFADVDQAFVQLVSTLLFCGTFVSVLFLLAAGCSLYFKIFTQQEEDIRQLKSLSRVGLRRSEAMYMISSELLLLFFLPVLIAVLHSSVATLDLLHLMSHISNIAHIVWMSLLLTSGIYTVFFAAYFILALVRSLRLLRTAML